MKILIADDSATSRSFVAGYLRDAIAGAEIEEAARGDFALQAARRNPPDLIVTDLRMPGMDGLDVAKALRRDALTCAIPIVLCTSDRDPATRMRATIAGVALLPKPVEPGPLMVSVRAAQAIVAPIARAS